MPETCPQCGADWSDDKTCEDTFNEMISLEFIDPRAGAVHQFTVLCYMLQHNLYTEEAAAWARERLVDFLERGFSTEDVRRTQQTQVASGERKWKVVRSGTIPPPSITWTLTIKDALTDDLDAYAARVTAWAQAMLNDLRKAEAV